MILSFAVHLFCSIISCIPTFPSPEPSREEIQKNLEKRGINYENEINDHIVWLRNGGGLEGFPMRTVKGRQLHSFQSIPYAKPPIGHLRFRPPQPYGSWIGIRQAKKKSPVCLQLDMGQYYRVEGHEDCLYLNIYTPHLPSKLKIKKKLPTLIFIHGGANFFGSSSYYGPSYLLDQDLILVTINYRLGILGFLSTGDEIAPGNYGLKDQSLAIKWVYENIENFGGTNSSIHLWGQSAGGSDAQLHLISKTSQSLKPPIKSLIAQSGLAFSHWSIVNNTIKNTYKLAGQFGCDFGNHLSDKKEQISRSEKLVDCLRSQNPYLVVYQQMSVYCFGPVIENPGPDSFLDISPELAYEKRLVPKIPILAGIVANEGDFFALQQLLYPNLLRTMSKKWNEKIPIIMDFKNRSESYTSTIAEKLRTFYFDSPETPINFWSRKQLSKMLGDRLIVQGVYKGLKAHSQVAPTFGYLFNFRGRNSVVSTLGARRNDWDITHLDEFQYLLNSSIYYPSIKTTDAEYEITDFLINTFANFVTFGKPFYKLEDGEEINFWEEIKYKTNKTNTKLKILEINQDPKMISFPFERRMKFLKKLNI